MAATLTGGNGAVCERGGHETLLAQDARRVEEQPAEDPVKTVRILLVVSCPRLPSRPRSGPRGAGRPARGVIVDLGARGGLPQIQVSTQRTTRSTCRSEAPGGSSRLQTAAAAPRCLQ